MSKPNWRSILANLCILSASLTLTLVVAECVLRSLRYDAFGALKNGRELILRPSPHPEIKYELTPGASGRAWGSHVEINAHGYRGRLGAPGKFPGYRIIVLGDSISFGNFLSVESTFPHQLGQSLSEYSPEYEVLNFGVGGYDTLQEVALLELRGPVYLPDLVIVAFCLNDIGIASLNLNYIERVRQYQANSIFRSRLAQFVAKGVERIRMGNWMRHRNRLEVFKRDFEGRIAPIGQDEHELRSLMHGVPELWPSAWYQSEERVGRLRYAFQRLATLGSTLSFSVIVAIIPWLVESDDSYPHANAHRIVALEAERADFDTVDLTRDFLHAGMATLKVEDNDPIHPNRHGHRMIAESLFAQIRELRQDTTMIGNDYQTPPGSARRARRSSRAGVR